MPQYPIAQDGSVWVTWVNTFTVSGKKNECSMARPRSNSAWACGVHETGKLTLPSFSSLDTRAGVVEKPTDTTVKARATRVALVIGRFMSVSSSLETVGERVGNTRSERVASQGSVALTAGAQEGRAGACRAGACTRCSQRWSPGTPGPPGVSERWPSGLLT